MTSKEINESIESMKIHLNQGDKVEHWLNFIFLLVPLCCFGFITIYEPIQNNENPYYGIIVVLAFCLLLRHKIVSTKLNSYKSKLTSDQFMQANQASARLNEWVVLSNRKNYFAAIKGSGWQWEGVKISAILKDDKVYLNSMVNPSSRSNPFTFGLNRKNKYALLHQYQQILKGQNVTQIADKEIEKREQEFWNESELSLKNLLMKIIGYPLGIAFASLAIWMITSLEIKGVIFGLITLGFVGSYFYYDIKIIIEKTKRRKSQAITSGDDSISTPSS